jgi:hypothetical protein
MGKKKYDNTSSNIIKKKIEDLFKDGRVILDGPISMGDKFWSEVKNPEEDERDFMGYLKTERDKAAKLAEVSNDPSFWLGKVDAFLDIENKILSILKKYKEK